MLDAGQIMFFGVFALVLLLVLTAKQSRRHAALTDRKQCRQCGARYGAEALYCGRCGRAF